MFISKNANVKVHGLFNKCNEQAFQTNFLPLTVNTPWHLVYLCLNPTIVFWVIHYSFLFCWLLIVLFKRDNSIYFPAADG